MRAWDGRLWFKTMTRSAESSTDIKWGLLTALARAVFLALVACAFLGSSTPDPAVRAPRFEVSDLGPLQKLASDLAPGLNSKGDVVVWRQSESLSFATVLWTGGRPKTLETPSGYRNSFAYSVNDNGNAAGWANTTLNPVDSFSIVHAVMLSDHGDTDLGTLGGRWSRAYGINNHDVMVGVSELVNKQQRAFQYTKGKMSELAPLAGSKTSIAFAINDAGVVVGGAELPQPDSGKMVIHAVRWRDGVPEDLGALSAKGGSLAYAVNSHNEVVGKADVGEEETAFLYRSGHMTSLGPRGGRAFGINDQGQIVGVQRMGEEHPHVTGFLWEAGKLYDLDRCLPAHSPYSIKGAFRINNAGQIAAIGLLGSELHALLLTPEK